MANGDLASVHQGTKPIISERGITTFIKWGVNRLSHKKLAYGLASASLVGASMLYISLGAHANGANGNDTDQTDQTSGVHNDPQPKPAAQPDETTTTIPNSDSLDVNLNSTSQTSSDPNQNSNSTSLSVNGHQVPVKHGNVHQNFTSQDGHTKVQINSTTNSSSDGGDE